MGQSRATVAIDARYLSHGLVGGVHTYTANLVTSLLRVDPERAYLLVTDSKAPFEIAHLPDAVRVMQLPWSNPVSSVRNDIRIGREIEKAGADIAHFPANYGFTSRRLPALLTLHDAINLLPLPRIWRTHAKHPRTVLMMTYLHLATALAVSRDPFVVTVSEYSRTEILKYSRIAPHRVRVVPSAPERAFRQLPIDLLSDIRRRYAVKKHMLLADAIKNPSCVLRAFRSLPGEIRSQTTLLFFSRRTPSEEVQRAATRGECVVVTRPSQDELVNLYNLADLFVFPSWYEGFGLPVLEAMACGTPVIASSRGSLPEVTGKAGFVVDAEDHEEIARIATMLFRDAPMQRELQNRSLTWAARFSWEATARAMSGIYDELLDRSVSEQASVPTLVTAAR